MSEIVDRYGVSRGSIETFTEREFLREVERRAQARREEILEFLVPDGSSGSYPDQLGYWLRRILGAEGGR